MGACAMLPRIIGQGRAAELLYTGRSMGAEEAERWGFFNRVVDDVRGRGGVARGVAGVRPDVRALDDQDDARAGVGHVGAAAIESEAQAQAICMQTQDFTRAYEAFLAKERPVFEGD